MLDNLDDKNQSLDGEVFEHSNELHVWTNRNGMPKKFIRKKSTKGVLQGWHLLVESVEIAIAGPSKLPTHARNWVNIEERRLIDVQEYQGILIVCTPRGGQQVTVVCLWKSF